ncbi:MAG TPA: SDR family NAD(P)-dependent oxidoreductase [Thermoanaerobaculia bacterium]|jgi:non-ribosomal peptide synthase protein (TIGR01720 family)|nr:SDR family NAD(P)-dependent oxidoreductase [Thermoanaerobaculia bacterium]
MAKMNRFQHRSGLEVAVIGMAGRFPGARSVDELWRNLRAGVESITFFTDAELAAAGVDAALRRNPSYVPAKGCLADVDRFDAEFFGIGPREAEILDPQQRLFLECAWEAIESGGYDLERYAGWIGVYAGSGMSTYFLANLLSNPELLKTVGHLQVGLSNDKDYLATRTSYKLGLEGPSLNVQTACSTSLVAVHLACQALLRGECDMALAGGVSIGVPLNTGYLYQEGGILSPDGHTRTFDAAAAGCVGGNGVGLVLLKKLDEALADGDVIHAVIKGSALNNDGALKIGYTAPRIDGQAKVIRAAHIMADVPVESITYVEAHGTATELGDPAEISALAQAFSRGTEKRAFCAIGSVKSNLGHLDAAAGITGLIKATLALEHAEIPPSLHFRQPNPQIDFAETPFYVNAELRPWPAGDDPRRAGVSSFGIGGTNAHAILEEAPPPPAAEPSRGWQLLLLSARTGPALERAEGRLATHFAEAQSGLADAAYTLQVGRRAFAHRRMLVCRQAGEAVAALGRREPEDAGVCDPEAAARPIVFLLPGQGAQQVGMAAGLYRNEPAFRQILDQCADLLRPALGLDIRQILYPSQGRAQEAAARLRQTTLAQPVLFAVEYAMARLWGEWGIQPQALLGHSLGELVAACLAGVLRLEDALRVVARRGILMQSLPPGAMLSVPLPEFEVAGRLGEDLDLAAVNGPASCVVAGPLAAVESFRAEFQGEGVDAKLLETSHAFHSASMDAVRERFAGEMAKLELRAPQIPFLSNVTGTWIESRQATDPEYWGEHLRRTVRFAAGLEQMLASPERILLEVGPWGGLAPLARRNPRRDARTLVITSSPSPKESTPGEAHLLGALGRLWLAGARPDWQGFYRHERRRRAVVPTYPFERRRYWIDPAPARGAREGRRADPADFFWVPGWKRALPRRPNEERQEGLCLLFLDELGLGRALADRLARRGEAVATVTPGERFAVQGEGAYTIDPRQREDYEALLQDLCGSGRAPSRIVHLWTVEGTVRNPEPVLRERGFISLILLAQAIGEQMLAGGFGGAIGGAALTLTAISDHLHEVTGEEEMRPEKATLLGPIQVIPQEYPNVRCNSLDVLVPARESAAWQRLVERLAGDLAFPAPDLRVCYRGAERWIPVFDPLPLEEPAAPLPAGLRLEGCYLITGGLGGIGIEVARGLARTVRANLVLVGRSALPAREEWEGRIADGDTRLRTLREIEDLGGGLMVVSADVADEGAMRRALDEATARFGRLHGVFHSAGLPGGTLIQRQAPEIAAAVLAAKVEGTLVLDRLLAGTDLDFLVLFSSLRSLLGGAGQVDYCAANCFLDAFALARSRRGQPTLAIGWEGWRDVGMGQDDLVHSGGGEDYVIETLSNAEGWSALVRLLGVRELPQIAVSVEDLPDRLRQVRQSRAGELLEAAMSSSPRASAHGRPQLATPFVGPRNPVEQTLAEIWSQLLGIEPIGVEDNFFELGGDSVASLQIVSKARQRGLRLTPRQVFQHQTIAGLAAASTGGTVRALQGLVVGDVPLTPIQHWFFESLPQAPHHYNQAVLLRCGEYLEAGRLERAVSRICEHHDALRLRFERTAAGWRQTCTLPGGPAVFSRIDLTVLAPGEQPAAITIVTSWLQASLDLAGGPLCRVALLELGPGQPQRLVWTIHHLGVDVVSWRILLQDLQTLYVSPGAILPAKTTSYQEWAERLRGHARSDELLREAGYWLGHPWHWVRPLPVAYPEGRNTSESFRTETLALDPEATRALLHDVPGTAHAQVNDLLLVALVQAFRDWTGEPRLVVDVEGHGRGAAFDDVDLSRTVGWFTSIYPVLLDLGGTAGSAGEDLKAAREQLRRIPDHGFGYGLLRFLSDNAAAERLARLPKAEVVFLYTGRSEGAASPSLYTPAPEALGPNQSPQSVRQHLLEITVSVQGERLRVEWAYSRNIWTAGAICGLIASYESALRALIGHCLGAGATELAAGDFLLAGLEETELEELRARFTGIADVYPLSPVQEGLLFHTLNEPGSGVYVTHIHWTFRGALDTAALQRAWHGVVERHTALRTAFAWERLPGPLQVVLRALDLPWEEHDWRGLEAWEDRFEDLLRADRVRGFQVEHPPLMRLHLLRLEDDVHRLVWTFHHLLIDGWSVHLIFGEVLASYVAFCRGGEPSLAAARSYRDYVAWLRRQDPGRAEAFWRRTLGGFSRPVPLPGALERSPGGAPVEAARFRRTLVLPAETSAALLALGRRQQLTLNTIVQGAWALLLASHANGQRDVVFGAVTSGRPESLEGVETMVGLFINTLPLRLRAEPEVELLPWLRQLQDQQAEMREFEYSSLVEVHGCTQVPRGQPLFDTLLVFENFPSVAGGGKVAELDLEILEVGAIDQNSYPLTITVYPQQEIVLEIATGRRWFDEATVDERLRELAGLLARMAARPADSLGELLQSVDAERRLARTRVAERRHADNLAKLRSLRPDGAKVERGRARS